MRNFPWKEKLLQQWLAVCFKESEGLAAMIQKSSVRH